MSKQKAESVIICSWESFGGQHESELIFIVNRNFRDKLVKNMTEHFYKIPMYNMNDAL